MDFLEFMRMIVEHPLFQGILAIITSSAFIALIGVVGKLLSNKRITNITKDMNETLQAMKELNATLSQQLADLQKELDETKKQAEASKEMMKTYVINSKAPASTKNEILRIDRNLPVVATPVEEVKETEEIITEVENTETDKPATDDIDTLVSKL